MKTELSRAGRAYVATVIACGVAVVVNSLSELIRHPVHGHWFVLAGLTLLSGSFTVRIPTIPARLSVSETFVFAAVLLYGPEAATIIVVLDSLIISLWLRTKSRRGERVLFNMAAPAVAIWVAAHVFFSLAVIEPLSRTPRQILTLVLPLFALALCYFLLNSVLIAVAVGFERKTTPIVIWRQNFLWLSLNYFSGASVAALLLPYLQAPDSQFVKVIGVILPLLLISYLTFKTALGRVEDANSHLRELNRLYLSTIETLAMAIDAKDQITHGHIRRVQTYAVKLARAVGITDARQIQAIEAAALLHDMGKLAVPEYILNKPGPLTPAEFDKMKLHASVGADILSAIDFPYPVVPIVRHHHENWDGTGYPAGLSGSDIPIGARILSVVDCFDALTSDRPYRPRLSDDDAIKILLARRGNMYDPLAVDTFIRLHSEWSISVDEPENEMIGLLPVIVNSPDMSQLGRPQTKLRLEQIAASRTETLGILELAQDLSASATPQEVSGTALKHLRRLLTVPTAVIFLKEESADELVALNAVGEHAAHIGGVRIRLGQRLSGWVGANRQSIRNSDPVLDLGEYARSATPPLRAALSTAICVGDELVGVISIYGSVADGFSLDDQRIIEALALHLARPLQASVAHSKRHPLVSPSAGAANPSAVVHIALYPIQAPDQFCWASMQRALIESMRQSVRSLDAIIQTGDGELAVCISSARVQDLNEIIHRIDDVLDKWREAQSDEIQFTTAVAISPVDGLTRDELLHAARGRIRSSPSSHAEPRGESIH